MSSSKKYSKFTLWTISALLLGACGGGGGGGSNGLAYTGPTSPATITADNGKQIVTEAYINGEGGTALGTIFASATSISISTTEDSGTPRIISMTQTLVGAVNRINLTTTNTPSVSRATQTETDTIIGSCGGSEQYSISFDDVTGNFSGTVTFTNYCEAGDTINGGMSMSGNVNPDTSVFGLMTMSFSSLTFSSSSDSFTIDGNITANPGAAPIVITSNMKLKDNSSGKVFWAENHVTTIYTVVAGEEISTTGRFYHPDYGYVELTTPTRMFIADTDEWPSSGVMIVTGANNSKVKLTAISNTTYNYEVDANGDGVYETQQLGQLWADL